MAAPTRGSSSSSSGRKNSNQKEENQKKKVDFEPETFSRMALATVMTAIKKSNELPFDRDDYDYYGSFKGFRNAVNLESKKMRQMMERILLQQGSKVNLANLELDEMFDVIVDSNDTILERVGTAIDEACGLRKEVDPVIMTTVQKRLDVNTSWNRKVQEKNSLDSCKVGNSIESGSHEGGVTYRLLAGRNVQRPQLKFKDKIDNSRSPFVPIIKEKPNSLKPLAIILEQTEYGEMYSHPYHCELDHFKVGDEHLNKMTAQKAKSLKDTPLHFVDSLDKLQELNSVLCKQKEFALDLEHHSYRTFQGITCLMQVSTRDADYIIDTLELRSELQLLNESFTDPKIVKVLHGADSDVEWLQRDLGLYLVNLFDTGQASRVLGLANFSLAFLLKHYCDVDADKQYQLADWRIRPLPESMVRYAREDTHYLLYIYECLKNELLEKGNAEKNLLLSVFQRSKILCEKRYVKPVFHSEIYLELYKKSRKVFNARQLYALRELHAWRDAIARAEDESTGYVLPNHMLLQISEVLPREHQGILACCNPIPTLVRQNLNDIHMIILKARDQSLEKTVEQNLQIEVDTRRHQVDLDNVLHCPHDFRQESGSCDDELTILDLWNKHGDLFQTDESDATKRVSLKEYPRLSALVSETVSNSKRSKRCDVDSTFKTYCSPFQRYSLVRDTLKQVASEPMTTSDKTKSQRDPAASVHKHFMDLVKIYGDAEKVPKEGTKLDDAEATTSSASKQDTSKAKRKQVDIAVNEVPNEPIRKKKVDREKDIKSTTKRAKKLKNKKRKLETADAEDVEKVQKKAMKIVEYEGSLLETTAAKVEEHPPSPKKAEIGETDNRKQNLQTKEETDETTARTATTKKGNKNKKNKKKAAAAAAAAITNDIASFQPFDYSGANFDAFKGGSTKKCNDDFNPNRDAARHKKSKRFNNKQRRSGNMGSTYTANPNKSGTKPNWPKL